MVVVVVVMVTVALVKIDTRGSVGASPMVAKRPKITVVVSEWDRCERRECRMRGVSAA